MNELKEAAEKALQAILDARLCKIDSRYSRAQLRRLLGEAEETLRRALGPPKPTRYRMAMYRYPDGNDVVFVVTDTDHADDDPEFLCWLGDWVEVEE